MAFPLVGLAVLLLSGGLPAHGAAEPAVVLPLPTGPHAVGRIAQAWVDAARSGARVAEPGGRREVRLVVWYPASSRPRPATQAESLPDGWRLAGQPGGSLWFLDLARQYAVVRVHAVPDAPLAPLQPVYPALIMQPAVGRLVIEYTAMAEELASHGYVVAGVMATDRPGSLPGELMAASIADTLFVLNRLARLDGNGPLRVVAGRLALDSIGVFGHSSGGAAALEVCQVDSRFKAGVDLDGYPSNDVARAGARKPFMFVWSEQSPDHGELWRQARRTATAIQRQLKSDGYQLMIKGTRHFNFSDHAVLTAPRTSTRFAVGPIDGKRGLAITTEYLRAFFDRYLKGTAQPLLTGASSPYPEVVLIDPERQARRIHHRAASLTTAAPSGRSRSTSSARPGHAGGRSTATNTSTAFEAGPSVDDSRYGLEGSPSSVGAPVGQFSRTSLGRSVN